MNRTIVVVMLAGAVALTSGLASRLASAQQQNGAPSAEGPAAGRAAAGSDVAHGKAVFEKWCTPCHGDGPGKPGTAALQALYKGQKPALLERRTDLTPDVTKTFVRNGVSVMPFFRKTEIGDADLDALAAYLAQ
jgi:mono/diheme cytochrome c family protein